ncbi:MAG: 2,3-bisphosphoglycerate-independent phosphoglycerate mutase [Anaerolineales bacterium]|nr:2,3-bisphosphoglycerate-independent phosphoglycerate mutase [Anaerolineales bacterium]
MANFDLMRQLAEPQGGKIVLLVMDGLGGIPFAGGALTELEAAQTPNLDRLATEGTLGLSHPLGRGITPGSGPAHLALFGYDPISQPVGRGVLSALGVGIELGPTDVAARGNFCTVDENGLITDRRAGRIGNDISGPLVEKLKQVQIPGVSVEVELVKEYRFVVVFRGEGLDGHLADTDPQETGVPPLPVKALRPEAAKTAGLVQQWIEAAAEVLKDDHPANMMTLRGFAQDPRLPQFPEVYNIRSACVAVYPMYKGVSRLVGMDVLATESHFSPADEFAVVADHWDEYDFFFVHIKPTDSRGEDGNFAAKAEVIETVDAALPGLLKLAPDVLIVTGDHSTPAQLRNHSWHPVPTLLWAPATHLRDSATSYGERQAQGHGGLGHLAAADLMPLALAHALRLAKYGA